jgi:multiple sugar transport system ATP-binding protein
MASVRLEGISKFYEKGKSQAVSDLNLNIEDGEFMVLVGPSGCGKSTTLRMIAGLEIPTSGEIFIGGRRVNDVEPKDRDIAMVFQRYALYPHMTVRENLGFGLKLRKYSRADTAKRVDEASEILGIRNLLDRKPRHLSGGEQQRVALGRAIVRRPSVFLFDEPLSNLDAKLRSHMRTEIKRLHLRLGSTMIYVTHDQVEAMTMGSRITVLNDGVIHQVDTPQTIYRRPSDLFVAGFIGTPPMNFFPAYIEGDVSTMVSFRNFRLELPPVPSHQPSTRETVKIILGIRPEDVHLDIESCRAATEIDAILEVLEPLGNETLLHFSCGPILFSARMRDVPDIQAGTAVKVFLDINKVHCFDPETGRRIFSPVFPEQRH